MIAYQLSPAALDDIDEILSYLAEQASPSVASRTEDRLFAAFEELAQTPGLGHLRSDLTSLPVHFFALDPYLIVHQRNAKPLAILAVLHGSRDLKKLLPHRL